MAVLLLVYSGLLSGILGVFPTVSGVLKKSQVLALSFEHCKDMARRLLAYRCL